MALAMISAALILAQEVKGKLIDEGNKEAILFANVALFSETGELITGSTTDLEGKFKLKADPGKYILKISVVGYEELVVEDILLQGAALNLGQLSMKQSSMQLEEVVVTAERSFIENKPGKQVLNVGKEISTGGGNITNVIKLLPAVEVTPQGDLSIRGNSNVKILINGREPAYGMSAETLLKQMPASTIEKVEVITNPSAKEDPSSAGGIINIVLKKNTMEGLNVALNVEAGGTPFRGNAGAMLNYAKNKTNTYLTYGYYKERYEFSNKDRTEYAYPGSERQVLGIKGDGEFNDRGHLIMSGFDYHFNDSSTFNAELMYNYYEDDWKYKATNTYQFLESGNSYNNTVYNKSYDKIDFMDLALKYDFNDKDKRKLALTGNISGGGIRDKRTIRELTEEIPIDTTHISSKGRFYIAELKGDYSYELTERSTIEAGGSSELLWFKAKQKHSKNEDSNYDFFQHLHSAYFIYTYKLNKLSLSLGARPEYYNSRTTGNLYEKAITQEYFSLYPNSMVQYNFGSEEQVQSMSLSYAIRIRRPEHEELDPVIDYSNPSHLRQGNLELKPEFIHSVELGYNFSKGKTKVNATVFAKQINNVIQEFTELREDNILFTTYKNHSKSKSLGLDFNTSFKPVAWWEISPAGMLMVSQFAAPSDSELPYKKQGGSWNLKVNNRFKYRSNNFQIQTQYYGENVSAFHTRKPYYQVNMGYKRNIFKGIGTLKLSVNDVFNSGGKEKYTYSGKGFTSDAEWNLNGRFFNVSLSVFIK